MTKKIISMALFVILLFSLCIVANAETKKIEYEMWMESPYNTSGITFEELNIYRAKSINELTLYPLSRLGSNYYFAICEQKISNGGYNGNTKTSTHWVYVILRNGSDFIVLSSARFMEEYFWDRGVIINNLSDKVTNTSWYTSRGSEVPYYVLQPIGRYGHSYYTGVLEQMIVTSGGKIYHLSSISDDGCQEYPTAYNSILYCRNVSKSYASFLVFVWTRAKNQKEYPASKIH